MPVQPQHQALHRHPPQELRWEQPRKRRLPHQKKQERSMPPQLPYLPPAQKQTQSTTTQPERRAPQTPIASCSPSTSTAQHSVTENLSDRLGEILDVIRPQPGNVD